jgi:MFS family permease
VRDEPGPDDPGPPRPGRRAARLLGSLRGYNFRLYFAGYSLSATGEWMQRIGQAWLVLELSDSGTLLGVTAGLQYLPILVLGPWGGVVADRVDKRRLLLGTQGTMAVLAFTLWLLTVTGAVRVWMVLALALALGCAKAVSRPAEQTFVMDMVGPANLVNAVALSAMVFNGARAVGPAIAGVLITTVGLEASFLFNALSFVGVIVALLLMRVDELHPAPRSGRAPGQLREGFRYVRRSPELLGILLLMATAGLCAYEWEVTLPLLARDAFGRGEETFAAMFTAVGVGATLGGVAVAGFLKPSTRGLIVSGLAFCALLFATAVSPGVAVTLVLLTGMGAAHMAFRSTAVSLLQLRTAAHMRGRVMALFTVAVVGTAPVGAPLMGWLAETVGIRWTMGGGATLTALAALAALRHARRPAVPVPSGPAGSSGRRDAAGRETLGP